MAITPADIQAQTFSEAKRGYDPAEVDVFLEQLATEVDAMLAKIVDLKNRLTATEQQLADAQNQLANAQAQTIAAPAPVQQPSSMGASERQISAALIAAQQTADAIVAEAQQNADHICNEADAKARDVIRQALQEKQEELKEIDRLKASREEFKEEYLNIDAPYRMLKHAFTESIDAEGHSHVTFWGTIQHTDTIFQVSGEGNGPIDAFFNAIHGQKMDRFTFVDYKEHAISDGSDSMAVAYIQLRDHDGNDVFGVGIDHNINLAPLRGILSAINRAVTAKQ